MGVEKGRIGEREQGIGLERKGGKGGGGERREKESKGGKYMEWVSKATKCKFVYPSSQQAFRHPSFLHLSFLLLPGVLPESFLIYDYLQKWGRKDAINM